VRECEWVPVWEWVPLREGVPLRWAPEEVPWVDIGQEAHEPEQMELCQAWHPSSPHPVCPGYGYGSLRDETLAIEKETTKNKHLDVTLTGSQKSCLRRTIACCCCLAPATVARKQLLGLVLLLLLRHFPAFA